MIFPGKTNDVIYVLILYEEIETGGLSAAQDQRIRQKPELCGSWAKLSTNTGCTRFSVSSFLSHPPVCCWGRRENQGESGDTGKDLSFRHLAETEKQESSPVNSCLRPSPFPTVNL